MKKLMIVLAAVAMAACAQAVQVKWGSGMIYSPDSDGSIGASWNGSKWSFSQTALTVKGTLTAVIWESATALTELEAGKLYDAYVNKTTATTFKDATVLTGGNTVSAQLVTVNGGTSYASGDSVYSAVLYVLQEEGKDAWYMENYATASIGKSATTQQNLAQFEGGSATSAAPSTATPMSWTAVPEPTSGLLLLLGVAGLALKRKRA